MKVEIYNKIPQKEVESALLDDSKYSSKRWKLIASLEGNKEFIKEVELIKEGINLKFDIRLVLNGFFEEIPSMEIVKLRKKEQINIYSFWNEMESRDNKMKDIIRELVDDSFDNQITEEIRGYNGK